MAACSGWTPWPPEAGRPVDGINGPRVIMPSDVDNAFDIAFWVTDTALNENKYL